jgi:hypothetical protein
MPVTVRPKRLVVTPWPELRHINSRYVHHVNTGFITQVAEKAVEEVVAHYEQAPSLPWSVAFDHYLHGIICRILGNETAFNLRQPGYSFDLLSFKEAG